MPATASSFHGMVHRGSASPLLGHKAFTTRPSAFWVWLDLVCLPESTQRSSQGGHAAASDEPFARLKRRDLAPALSADGGLPLVLF